MSLSMRHLTFVRGLMRRAALAVLAVTFALAAGCGEPPAAVAPGAGTGAGPNLSSGSAGTLQIGVAVPPSFQIDAVGYEISKTGYDQSGTLDVTQSGTVTATLGGIPAGTGYTLALTATDVAKKFTGCSGSAPVAVTAGAVTPISVDIACHLPVTTVVTPPPQVPIPLPAVVLLAAALLYAGTLASGRRRRSPPPSGPVRPT